MDYNNEKTKDTPVQMGLVCKTANYEKIRFYRYFQVKFIHPHLIQHNESSFTRVFFPLLHIKDL